MTGASDQYDLPLRPMRHQPLHQPPLVRAPEAASTVHLVTLAAACAPLLAGIVLMGWRAACVAGMAIAGCAGIEWLYYRLTRQPAMTSRSHAVLTGMLLALTLPAFVPWYVPLVGAVFAIIIGKAVFGGLGHFVWQPALVGRLAVAVMFPAALAAPAPSYPDAWPVLAQSNIIIGDVRSYGHMPDYEPWHGRPAPVKGDAFLLKRPEAILAPLTRPAPVVTALRAGKGAYSSLWSVGREPSPYPAALGEMPPIEDLIVGAVPGGIGETSAAMIVVAGLYLIYRHYVKWQLPVAIVLSAAVTAAVAPIQLVGPDEALSSLWWPIAREGFDVGVMYVSYHLFSGGLLLAALFLATEQTTRPVTTGGQVLFGVGCGAGAMLLKLYTSVAIPCYLAVLAMNTFTQTIDRMWRPRVFGRTRWPLLRRLAAHVASPSASAGSDEA